MELTNQFRVGVPVDAAWSVLTDVERISPCLPGAQLQEVDGDDYRGLVKVKVGPITAQYKGKATLVDRDDVRHVAVLKADGRDTRGDGDARATITATLVPDGEGTLVEVVTQLTISGKVAQFGRGVLADVSSKLVDQFAECLEADLLRPPFQEAYAAEDDTEVLPPAIPPAEEEPTYARGAASRAWDAVAPLGAGRTPPGEDTPLGVDAEADVEAESGRDETRAEPAPRTVDHAEAAPIDLLDAAGVPAAKRTIPLVAGILVILWFLRRRRARR